MEIARKASWLELANAALEVTNSRLLTATPDTESSNLIMACDPEMDRALDAVVHGPLRYLIEPPSSSASD